MSEYKLVPVEPTKEQIAEFKSMWTKGFCDDRMARNCYKAFMDAAPAVQGEPVLDAPFGGILYLQVDGKPDQWRRINPCKLYAASPPTEQQTDDSASVCMDKQCREDVAAALGFVRGGNYAWSYLLQQIKEITSAEGRQPEPELFDALKEAKCTIQALIDEGYSGYVEQRERIDRLLAKATGAKP